MSVIKQIRKELEKVENLSTLRKELAVLRALRQSDPVEQKTVIANVSAYLATK